MNVQLPDWGYIIRRMLLYQEAAMNGEAIEYAVFLIHLLEEWLPLREEQTP